jgi:hypothetical protein
MQPATDPRPTLRLTTDTFLFANDARLQRFLTGQARAEELEAVAAIGDEPYEITTDEMLSQLDAYREERKSGEVKRAVLKDIRVMLAARPI